MFQEVPLSPEVLSKFDRYTVPYFHQSIRFALEGKHPLISLKLFKFTASNGTIFYYLYKESKLIQPHINFTCEGQYSQESFLEGFNKFQAAIALFSPPKDVLLIAKEYFNKAVKDFISTNAADLKVTSENRSVEFIVPPEKEKFLLEVDVKVPEGYSLGAADPKDTKFITSKWKYAAQGEEENTVEKLKAAPSSAIYLKDELVGFEMVSSGGCLNHQFVLEQHRSKGLGKAIEMDLAKKCISAGMTVFKHVEPYNQAMIESALRTPFWSATRKENGEFDLFTWLQLRTDV